MMTNNYESQSPPAAAAISQSGVSWAAIFAGALAAGVLSLLLFMLGVGLGLSSVSVWSGQGADGSTIGWGAVIWLVITQLASAGVGGYLAGRLRTKWQGVHTDEVYFRDTAHGFLSWALATIGMVILAGSVLSSAITGVGKAAGAVASGAAQVAGGAVSAVGSAVGTVGGAAGSAATAALTGAVGAATGQAIGDNDLTYWINSMLRQGGPTEAQKQEVADKAQEVASDVQQKAQRVARQARSAAEDAQEITGIFSQALKTGKLPDQDADYVARLIAQHTDVSQADAKEQVVKTFGDIQQGIEDAKQAAKQAQETAMRAAEDARKAAAHSMLWIFVVLLVGAFVGSLSATYGGRQRNND